MNTKWLIKNWFRVGHNISWKLSIETLISLLYFVPPFKNDFFYKVVKKKHAFVLGYLKRDNQTLLDKYNAIEHETAKHPEKKRIWVMWWQGEENAPSLVKVCLSSIRKNANGAEVVLITKDNVKEYADVPDYIFEKHSKGYISFAQLSDILRIFLISRHGGLWLDATIFTSQPIPEEVFHEPFYSLHTSFRKTGFVQNDRVHCFVLGGMPNSRLIMFEREFLSNYWEKHDTIIDYYLLDYSIMLAYWNIPYVHDMIDSLRPTSDGLYKLVNMLDDEFDEAKLNGVLQENIFSKLVWNVDHKYYRHGKLTNYGYLANLAKQGDEK